MHIHKVPVHSWYRLPNPDGFFYPTRTPVPLSIHHLSSLPVYHTVMYVIKTLLDRCKNLVTEPDDRRKEERHIAKAVHECGYPKCTIRNIRENQQNQRRKTKDKNNEKSRDLVTLSYVQGVTEPVQHILRHHDIVSAIRPHRNLRQIPVHPKDKVEVSEIQDRLCVPNPM